MGILHPVRPTGAPIAQASAGRIAATVIDEKAAATTRARIIIAYA
jgi:hypothetical protein